MPNEIPTSDYDFSDTRFAIVVARFNEEITNNLLDGAVQALRGAGADDQKIDVARVPGAWEIPLVAKRLAQTSNYQAIICLGAVIKGKTSHDQHINHFVSDSLGHLGLEFGIPIAFGILTCNDRQQAVDRAGGAVANRGTDAALAALDMCRLLKSIG